MPQGNRALTVTLVVTSLACAFVLAATGVAQANRAFATRYSATERGSILQAGNSSLTCARRTSCTNARAGSGSSGNDEFTMTNVDVDSSSATFNSTRAQLTLPVGRHGRLRRPVLGRGHLGGHRRRGGAHPDPQQPGAVHDAGGELDDADGLGHRHGHHVLDALPGLRERHLERASSGSGTYTVGNVQAGTGRNRYAGWGLVVAYRLASETLRRLVVYDGYVPMSAGTTPSASVTLSDFVTPGTGTVRGRLGLLAYEGDRQLTGESATLENRALTDAANPTTNLFNSSRSRDGTAVATGDPTYANTLGMDVDDINVDGLLRQRGVERDAALRNHAGRVPAGRVHPHDRRGAAIEQRGSGDHGHHDGGPDTHRRHRDLGRLVADRLRLPVAALQRERGLLHEHLRRHLLDLRAEGGGRRVHRARGRDREQRGGQHERIVDADPGDRRRPARDHDLRRPLAHHDRLDADASSSAPTSPARRSSAGSTAAPGRRAPRRTPPRRSPTASTPSRSAQSTSRAPPTRLPRRGRSRSTPPRRRPPSRPGRRGPTSSASPSFAFSSNEAGASFACRIDGGAWGPCASPQSFGPLADGQHTVEVRATDTAGNVDATPAARTFTVDTRAPQTTVTAGPAGPSEDSTPTFSFASDENGGRFECRMDGGAFAACDSPFTPAALSDGAHTFEVRAVDAAGNADATPASRTVVVDTSPPDTTIVTGPAGTTGDASPAFTFHGSETGASFQCRLDGGTFAACSSPHLASALAEGPHTLEVRAVDAAGNVDPTPASRTFTVDTVAPDTTITSGPTGTTDDPTPAFAFSGGAGVDLRVPRRRRRLHALLLALRHPDARRRQPHLPGPRHRRRPQRRSDARDPDVHRPGRPARPRRARDHHHRRAANRHPQHHPDLRVQRQRAGRRSSAPWTPAASRRARRRSRPPR